jgi:hypothetical protein
VNPRDRDALLNSAVLKIAAKRLKSSSTWLWRLE